MEKFFGFHLCLSQKDNEILLPIIESLQREFEDKPAFEPHISAHTAINTTLDKAIEAVKKTTGEKGIFEVETEGFGFQEKWSKVFYIQIKKNDIITEIHENLGRYLHNLDPRPYIPHISLMYKDHLPDSSRQKIISGLRIPLKFQVTGIRILTSQDDLSWRDYLKWKVEYYENFKQR